MFPNGAFGSRCNLRWKAYWFGNFTTHQCKQTKHVFTVYKQIGLYLEKSRDLTTRLPEKQDGRRRSRDLSQMRYLL